MNNMTVRNKKNRYYAIVLLGFSGLLIWYWLGHTPPGLDGKINSIGYTVCHQMASHSFQIGQKQFPICSRCTGMYLGVFTGGMALLSQRKKLILPTKKQLYLFGAFVLMWILDGINSFLSGLPGKHNLYQPNNILRFLTGFGMGLCVAVTVYFLFNYVVWEKQEEPTDIRKTAWLQILSAGVIFLILVVWQNEIFMSILSYLSVMTIILLLILLHTIIWILILGKENSFIKPNELALVANAGFNSALVQVILLDAFRLATSGSWAILVK